MNQIIMHPIGIIHSPYKEIKDIPIQGIFNDKIEAWIELKDEYVDGLKDLDQFSHAIIIYYFHKSQREEIEGEPFLEQNKHGIFAIRSPHRPNHIGVSIVKIKSIRGNKMYFTEVDALEGPPLLDIKPYVKYFDSRDDVVSGWLDKHLKNGNIPDKTIKIMKFDKKGAVMGAFVGAFVGATSGVTNLGMVETIVVAIIIGAVAATVINILWK